ncbi:Uncharacterised protein [uncultured archaeon]|nr:Uncharacterised protein [uncultured archaeon]
MIIRILGEGQFRLDDRLVGELNRIDNRIVDHVQKGDNIAYKKELSKLISIIREKGEALDPMEIVPSGIIVPPSDLSLEEARQVFCGEGLIKD